MISYDMSLLYQRDVVILSERSVDVDTVLYRWNDVFSALILGEGVFHFISALSKLTIRQGKQIEVNSI